MAQARDVGVGSRKGSIEQGRRADRPLEVHFDEAGELGAQDVGPLDGEVEPRTLGRHPEPALVVLPIGAIGGALPAPGSRLWFLAGIPQGVHLDIAAQAKFSGGKGGRGTSKDKTTAKIKILFIIPPL